MNKPFYLLFTAILLSGCTNQSLYESGQNYQKSKCIQEAQTAEQHKQCLTQERQSFKEYEQERQEVIGKK
ncbi:hypothetical protein [Psychrobium sp. 1_MG-2023]|uniref:hypothetical protein n=1 Tax=Psychrobium sp. 1_MG-2023 TaxID=3062624 RepID=UPI000C34334B|nr:hypothetical protein [Psychrobium sp. 1_MG-2023]MDP2562216.1 hypothetical protein [Psychrobium sp. 1_MG-2023]PKF58083.1 hypothetical protein CW748_04585 [Alteromonadales bacterium alter-6D02]